MVQLLRLWIIQTLRISSKGPASTHQRRCMGEYTRIEEERNGRPVWRHQGGQEYFYYSWSYTSGNRWVVGPDYTEDSGWIQSGKAGLATIPEYGWQYYDRGDWPSDPQLRVEGEWRPPHCTILLTRWHTDLGMVSSSRGPTCLSLLPGIRPTIDQTNRH